MRKKLSIVIKKLCNDFDADYNLVDTKTRKKEIILVRHMIFYFLKEETTLSFSEIGAVFNQDHSNALASIKKVKGWLESPDKVFNKKMIEWYRINEIQVRKMIDMSINGNGMLIKKKYRHYEIVEMVAKFFSANDAERFEKFLIKK